MLFKASTMFDKDESAWRMHMMYVYTVAIIWCTEECNVTKAIPQCVFMSNVHLQNLLNTTTE